MFQMHSKTHGGVPIMRAFHLILVATVLIGLNLKLFGGEAVDTAKIDQVTGLKGVLNEKEGVFKVSVPRTDVKVSVDEFAMSPFMGLTSWAAFHAGKAPNTMVMGDLVLFQDEV